MKRFLFTIVLVFLVLALLLSSCSRVKKAVGADRLQDADAAVIPDDKEGDPHAESYVVSYGDETDIVVEDSDYHKVGEPVLCDSSAYGKRHAVMQYTVTDVHAYDDPHGISKDKIYVMQEVDHGQLVDTIDLDSLFDEEGKLLPDYLFVLADIKMEYVSGPEDETEHRPNVWVCYKHFPDKVVDEIIKDGETTITTPRYLDADGNLFKDEGFLGYYSSPIIGSDRGDETPTVDLDKAYYVHLNVGENTSWQEGGIVKKSTLEKYGLCFLIRNVNNKDAERVDLGDLSDKY